MRPSSSSPTSITSPQNEQLKRWTSLLDSRGLKRHQQCLVSGKKLVRQILDRLPHLCLELILPNHHSPSLMTPPHVIYYQLTQKLFQKLDLLGTHFPLLVCRFPSLPSANLTKPPHGLEVLCPFGDPSNIGTIIRSCCAFDVDSLILLQEAAHPFHPKSIRASSGAVFDQPISWGSEMADLQNAQILQWIIALDLKGKRLSSWKWPKNVRLLIGEEGLGLQTFSFPRTLTIPQTTKANSLNAAIAASIALFSYRQQHPLL